MSENQGRPRRNTPNRLIDETSPYLLQHAWNPVDWLPWGPEALALARDQDRPIFLSIGYSACHWCHVMERESFEDPGIAALMNEGFVNVKVDREERPDLDQIYMTAVQAMNDGHGGWPMSVFLTPDGHPFHGGTYYPPEDRRGMPGFPRVLRAVRRAWNDRRDEIRAAALHLTDHIQSFSLPGIDLSDPPRGESEAEAEPGPELFELALAGLKRSYDPRHGGFGSAPKFPHPMDLKFLLRSHARSGDPRALEMAVHTLDRMSRGGIRDHLGGGFARYSTDARWLAPHFEKMLYDNALLADALLETHQLTGDATFARTARETLDYVRLRMTDAAGAFHATEDADSEGEEGKYYVWTDLEIRDALGPERFETFALAYDVAPGGNWEGKTILNRPLTPGQLAERLGRPSDEVERELAESRRILLEIRERRVPPGKDEKILASWNGLMIGPMAEAARVFDDLAYLQASQNAAAFILENMRADDGRLLRVFKDGRARVPGYLDDYANLADGLLRLHLASGEFRWALAARELLDIALDEFGDGDAASNGLFHYTGRRHESLVARPRELLDNATPSAVSMMATALLRLAAVTGESAPLERARLALRGLKPVIKRVPGASAQALLALDFDLAPPWSCVLFPGEDPDALRRILSARYKRFLPAVSVVAVPNAPDSPIPDWPLLDGKSPTVADGQPVLLPCREGACLPPVVGLEPILAWFRAAR